MTATDDLLTKEENSLRGILIRELYPVGFKFSVHEPTVDKSENVIGIAQEKLTTIQIIGSSDKLKRISLMLGLPRDVPNLGRFQGLVVSCVLKLCFPNWKLGPDQVVAGFRALVKKSPILLRTDEEYPVLLELRKKEGLVIITIGLSNERRSRKK